MAAEPETVVSDTLRHFLGTAAASFFDEHWLKKPLHVDRGLGTADDDGAAARAANFYNPFFAIPDIEPLWHNAVASAQTDGDNPIMYKSGPKFVDVKSPFFAFPHRCSVVFNRADQFSEPVRRLCEAFQTQFPFVYCNIYLTPPGAQTAPPHTDDRDVFLLQIDGAKDWTVWRDPPTPLPYRHEEFGKNWKGAGAAPPSFDPATAPVGLTCTLRRGDLLYIPRGCVHAGRALDECSSLHLTMAVQTSDWDVGAAVRDGVKAVVGRLPSSRPVLSPAALRALAAAVATNDGAPVALDAAAFAGATDAAAFATCATDAAAAATLPTCAAALAERLRAMRLDRDEKTAAKTQAHHGHPVTGATLVVWNRTVRLRSVAPTDDALVASVKWVALLEKVPPPGKGGAPPSQPAPTMPLSLSDETKRLLVYLSREAAEAPVAVEHFPFLPGGALAQLCAANWLLRNQCLLRVS